MHSMTMSIQLQSRNPHHGSNLAACLAEAADELHDRRRLEVATQRGVHKLLRVERDECRVAIPAYVDSRGSHSAHCWRTLLPGMRIAQASWHRGVRTRRSVTVATQPPRAGRGPAFIPADADAGLKRRLLRALRKVARVRRRRQVPRQLLRALRPKVRERPRLELHRNVRQQLREVQRSFERSARECALKTPDAPAP